MAKDRKRPRPRTPQGDPQPPDGGAAPLASMPGSLQHSGDVDEFDAAMVRGADAAAAFGSNEPVAANGGAEAFGDGAAAAEAAFGATQNGEQLPAAHERTSTTVAAPRRSIVRRAAAFLQASWAELQRVQWPDRRQVSQATAVVLGFVAIAGLYLGAADWVAEKVVNFIL